MHLNISHQLSYRYDRPVFFEPTLIRLCPRHDHIQHLLDFDLQVTPSPAGSTSILDVHDNRTRVFWFNDMHEQMRIRSTVRVQVMPHSPFDYLITDSDAEQLPVTYSPVTEPALAMYRRRTDMATPIDALAKVLQDQARGQTLEYLRRLVLHVPDHCAQVHREEGEPWPASQTLGRGEGSCRDLTVLFMELCRAVGLASRFVSGYCTLESLHQTSELHAWSEVYLPGAGWRGYDPTAGVATGHEHIVLATASDAANAAPTEGTYRGTDAQSWFEYEIQIKPDNQ